MCKAPVANKGPAKGQLISKCFFVSSILPKNERKQFDLWYHSSTFVFWEKLRYQKDISKLTNLYPRTILKRSLTYLTDFYLSAHRFTKCRLYLFHTPIFTDFHLSAHRFTNCKLYLFHTPISLIFICLCIELQIANCELSAHRFTKCMK